MFPPKPDEQNGRVTLGEATEAFPEWLSLAIHKAAAKGRLSEKDALWGLLVANGELMRSYLDAQADGTKQSIQKLENQVRDYAQTVQRIKHPETTPENIAWRSAFILVAALLIFAGGYFMCWSLSHLDLEAQMIQDRQIAEDRVKRVIALKPAGFETFLDFVSYGARLTREPIQKTPGRSEVEAFIVQPGNLSKPLASGDGEAAILPIPLKRQ